MIKSSITLKIISLIMAIAMLLVSLPIQAIASGIANAEKETDNGQESTVSVSKDEVLVLYEEESLRTENTKNFRLSDGTVRAVSYMGAVHYQDENGKWMDIDNSLVLNGSIYEANNKTKVELSKKSNGTVLKIKDGEYKISFAPLLANKVNVEIENPQKNNSKKLEDVSVLEGLVSKAIYKGIYDGIDLEYILAGNSVKENIIVNEQGSDYTFSFQINLSKLRAELCNGAIVFYDYDTGKEAYKIPTPYMYDARGEYSTEVEYSLKQESKWEYTLTVSANAEWINAENRTLPVVIDPTVVSGDSVTDTFFLSDNGNYSSLESMIVGNFMGYTDALAFVKFNSLPSIPANATLMDAKASFLVNYTNIAFDVAVYEAKSSWSVNNTYSQMTEKFDIDHPLDFLTLDDVGIYAWDITNLYSKWQKTPSANHGICLKAINLEELLDEQQTYVEANARLMACENPTGYKIPQIEVTYRISSGIDEIQPQIDVSAGVGGTGYINAYSGKLSQTVGLGTTVDEILPYSVGITYTHDENGVLKWIASYDESVSLVYANEIASNANIEDYKKYEYKWIDSDGSVHYFSPYKKTNYFGHAVYCTISPAGTVYEEDIPSEMYDEDGLGLTLVKNYTSGEVYILDESGNIKVFGSDGRLSYIQDVFGNQRHFVYTNGRLSKITLKPNGVNAIDQLTMTYDANGNLAAVSNMQSKTTAKLYYTGGLISRIEYISARAQATEINRAQFYYDGVKLSLVKDNKAGIYISYIYDSSGRIAEVYEQTGASYAGNKINISYDIGKTVVTDVGENHESAADNVCTAYVFDKRSMLTCVYSYDYTTKEIYGASTYQYYDKYSEENVGPKKHNKIKDNVQSTTNTPNLLVNPNFNKGTQGWSKDNSITMTLVDNAHFISMSGTIGSLSQSVNLEAGEYTLSLYINKRGTSQSAKIGLVAGGVTQYINVYRPDITEDTADLWEREELRFTVQSAGSYSVKIAFYNAGNTAIDNVMLEKGTGASAFSAYDDGEFNKRTANVAENSIFSGKSLALASSSFTNQVNLGDGADLSKWVISLWGKAENSVASANLDNCSATFGVRIKCGEYEKLIPFNTKCSDWQFISSTLSDESLIGNTVQISIVYEKNSGTAYFDKVTLCKLGSGTSLEYNLTGNVTEKTDQSTGKTTVYEYDGANAYDPTRIGDDKSFLGITYDDNRQVSSLSTELESGASAYVEYGRNALGQIIMSAVSASTQALKMITSSTYVDEASKASFSRVESETDETGAVTKYFYDETGLLTGICVNDDDGVIYDYDIYGQLIKVSSARCNEETDSLDYVAYSSFVDYEYDEKYQLEGISTELVDYTFAYDDFGNMLSASVGDEAASQYMLAAYEYGAHNGNLKRVQYGNGTTLYYTYDNLDRVVGMCYTNNDGSTSVISYTYSSEGRLSEAYDSANNTVYRYYYDAEGKLLSEKAKRDNVTLYDKQCLYDDYGKLTGIATYNGEDYSVIMHAVNYTYNDDDQVTAVTNSNGQQISYTYDDFGRLDERTSSYGGLNLWSCYDYTLGKNPATQTTALVASEYIYKNQQIIGLVRYTYDSKGNIIEICSENEYIISYEYDEYNQLIRENNSKLGYTYLYSYDTCGNLRCKETRPYSTAPSNEITNSMPISMETYGFSDSVWGDLRTEYSVYNFEQQASTSGNTTYDGIGNPLSYFNGTQYTFIWQNGRQLSSATVGGGTVTYKYNQDGIRIEKSYGSYKYEYTLNGTQITRERLSNTSTGAIVRDSYYFYDASGIISSARIYVYNGSVATEYNLLFRTNIQGDVCEILNSDGTSIMSIYYDAWGNFEEEINCENTQLIMLAYEAPFRYRSYYYDSELSMYYLNTRYYDAKMYRFINADDFTVIGATPGALTDKNLFAYCDNNPVMRVDDNGDFWLLTALAGAVAGVAGQVISNLISGKKGTIEEYIGAAIGGAIGIFIPDPILSSTISAMVATGVGMALENLTYSLTGEGKHHTSDEIAGQIVTDGFFGLVAGAFVPMKVSHFGDELARVSSTISRNFIKDSFEAFVSSVPSILYSGMKPKMEKAVRQ